MIKKRPFAWSDSQLHGIIPPRRPESLRIRETMDQTVDHDALDHLLKSCGSNWNAGQVHGLLCGRLAVTGADGATNWFAQILEETDPDNPLRGECEAVLDGLFQTTWGQLVDRQSEFTLLLPDDEESATQRAEAMGQWC